MSDDLNNVADQAKMAWSKLIETIREFRALVASIVTAAAMLAAAFGGAFDEIKSEVAGHDETEQPVRE